MWIRLLLSGLIIAFSVLIGYLAANKYRSRKNFFAQFEAFNARYISELSFSRKPLAEFLAAFEYSGEFAKTLKEFSEKRQPAIKYSFLTDEEKSDAQGYFAMLGKGDSFSQRDFFSAKKQYLTEKKASSEQESAKKSSLYLKLGLLAGLAIVILII